MKQFIIIMIVLGCVYGRGIPKKPNSKRNAKDNIIKADFNRISSDLKDIKSLVEKEIALENQHSRVFRREDIHSVNMRHGILSDMKFKDNNKREILNLWKESNGQPRVPYVLDMSQGQDYSAIIKEAIKALNSYMKNYSCISYPDVWVPRISESNYVTFTTVANGGCWSYVGKIGGKQQINIGDGCQYKGTVLHEMLHAMGFIHEQSRCDRTNALEIVYSNIQSGYASQFDIESSKTSFTSKYDIWSVMQYHLWAFSKYNTYTESTKTIKVLKKYLNLTTQEEWKVGESNDLSETDKLDLNIMYGCLAPTCTVGCDGVEKCSGVTTQSTTTSKTTLTTQAPTTTKVTTTSTPACIQIIADTINSLQTLLSKLTAFQNNQSG